MRLEDLSLARRLTHDSDPLGRALANLGTGNAKHIEISQCRSDRLQQTKAWFLDAKNWKPA